MPELFIGIKLSDSPSPTLTKNQCQVCLKPLAIAKLLACGHMVCATCFENLQRNEQILCPIDKISTKFELCDPKDLPTRIFIKMKCDDCERHKDFHKTWWCETCACTSCSNCAMHKHRLHACEPWDTLEVIAQCYGFLRAKNSFGSLQNLDETRKKIKNYCNELETRLTRQVDKQTAVVQAQKTLEDTFGTITNLDGAKWSERNYENIDKKISLVSELIPRIFGSRCGSLVMPKGSIGRPLSLPPIEHTIEFCTNEVETKEKIAKAKNAFLFGTSQELIQGKEKLLY